MGKTPSSPPHRKLALIAVCVLFFPVWFPVWALAVIVAAQFDRTRQFARWLREAGRRYRYGGFTLVELSIVLVIIGLIVGGVLVGRDMIKAAEVRATITQIEKFNTAATTFYGKYGYLPGDITATAAAQFGFASRGGGVADGDGNGVLEACVVSTRFGCETALFWSDLMTAGLIAGNPSAFTDGYNYINVSGTPANPLPQAAISSNYIAVFAGQGFSNGHYFGDAGKNYFYLGGIYGTDGSPDYIARNAISPLQAYAIDNKVDDGQPQSGRIVTAVANGGIYYDTSYSTSSCATSSSQYNLSSSQTSSALCQMVFKMQAGD